MGNHGSNHFPLTMTRYRRKRENLVERTAISRLPTKWGLFQAYCYSSKLDGTEHCVKPFTLLLFFVKFFILIISIKLVIKMVVWVFANIFFISCEMLSFRSKTYIHVAQFSKETPEPFLLPTEDRIVKAAAGWAHCASVTEKNDVYTWGWKECVPSSKFIANFAAGGSLDGDAFRKESSVLTEQESPRSQGSKSIGGSVGHQDNKKPEETSKRRRTATAKQELDSPPPADESLSAPPCIVPLDPGVKITSVSVGGRHTLALSDVGQYGVGAMEVKDSLV